MTFKCLPAGVPLSPSWLWAWPTAAGLGLGRREVLLIVAVFFPSVGVAVRLDGEAAADHSS